jgi:hypothetical protein
MSDTPLVKKYIDSVDGMAHQSAIEIIIDLEKELAAIPGIEVENAALRLDAERYRWLREKIENQNLTIAVADSWSLRSWSGDDSDAVIDAAMKEKGK